MDAAYYIHDHRCCLYTHIISCHRRICSNPLSYSLFTFSGSLTWLPLPYYPSARMHKRVHVCVCVESKFIRQTKRSCRFFTDFQLTELSEVVSFTSYRPFRSFFEVAAILLHNELPRALYAHAQAGSIWSALVAFLKFALLSRWRIVVGFLSACIYMYFILTEVEVVS